MVYKLRLLAQLILRKGFLNPGKFLLTIIFFLKRFFFELWDIETGKYNEGKWVKNKLGRVEPKRVNTSFFTYRHELQLVLKADVPYKILKKTKLSRFVIEIYLMGEDKEVHRETIRAGSSDFIPVTYSDEINDLFTMGYRNG